MTDAAIAKTNSAGGRRSTKPAEHLAEEAL